MLKEHPLGLTDGDQFASAQQLSSLLCRSHILQGRRQHDNDNGTNDD